MAEPDQWFLFLLAQAFLIYGGIRYGAGVATWSNGFEIALGLVYNGFNFWKRMRPDA